MTFVMPVIILYLVIGTVAQKYVGLYAATHIYFSAPIIWVFGFVPLPGMPILCALIFFNLVFKLISKSPWNKRHSGIIITHIGVALLLVGGLFTALFSTEGYIDLGQGDKKSYVSDYHERVFVVTNKAVDTVFTTPHTRVKVGDIFNIPDTALSIKILETCRNCTIEKRSAHSNAYTYNGMAQHMKLNAGALDNIDEENMAGVTFAVYSGVNDSQGSIDKGTKGRVYVTLEDAPQVPTITNSEGTENTDDTYTIMVRRARRSLPFAVELVQFTREVHPATQLPKAYESRVRIIDGDARWESVIGMNEPLRYKGYTFFQSSFAQTPTGEISVLAAVWNVGRAFPYISGIVICFGLIVHLFVRRRRV